MVARYLRLLVVDSSNNRLSFTCDFGRPIRIGTFGKLVDGPAGSLILGAERKGFGELYQLIPLTFQSRTPEQLAGA